MGRPVLAKRAAPQPPPAWSAWKSHLQDACGLALQAVRQIQFSRATPDQAFGRFCQQLFAGPVHQAQELLVVEGEIATSISPITLRSSVVARARRGAARARCRHGVYLLHHLAQRVVDIRAARPH